MATTPTISIAAQDTFIRVTVTSNAADSFVELERQFAGEDWVTITDGIPVGTSQTYDDYGVAHDKTAFYRATAVDGSSGRATSLTDSAVQSLPAVTAHVVSRGDQSNKSGDLIQLNAQEGFLRESSRAETVQELPALADPVVDVGTLVSRRWEVPIVITDDDELEAIRGWREDRSVICLRNGTGGDRLFGVIPEDYYEERLVSTGTLVIQEVDYRESIGETDALAAPNGTVNYRLRFVLYDRDRNEIGETGNIVGGFVRKTRKARIRSGAQFVVRRRDRDLDSYSALILASSPLLYWRLGDTSGTTAADASGNSRVGTYAGTPSLNQPSLLSGDVTNGSVFFDGTNDAVSIADAAWMDTDRATHVAWVKTSYKGADQWIGSRDDVSTQRQFSWYIKATTGFLSVFIETSAGLLDLTTTAHVSDGRQHMVAWTFDGSYLRVFVDGRQVARQAHTGTLEPSSQALTVGKISGGAFGPFWFNGTIDEYAWFGAALPASEIRAMYQKGADKLFEIDYLTDRIIPWVQMQEVDGSWSEWPLGEYIIPAPTRTDDETTSRHTVQAFDKLKLFDEYRVPNKYAVASGTAYTTAIATALSLILTSTEYTITPSASTLPATRSWKSGTSLLDIVNDLLKGIAYISLRFNGYGVAVLEPYVEPADRTPAATWNIDENSFVGHDVEYSTTMNETYNRVIGQRTTPKGALLEYVADNNEASHPTAIHKIGPKAIVVENSDAADIGALTAATRAELIKYMEYAENQKRKALLQPWLMEEDVIEINDTDAELSGTYLIDEVGISLDGRPPFWEDFTLTKVPELS
jgi:hypothetical protein